MQCALREWWKGNTIETWRMGKWKMRNGNMENGEWVTDWEGSSSGLKRR